MSINRIEIVSNEGIGLISVGLDGSVGAMKPLKGYDVTQVRELNGIREKVRCSILSSKCSFVINAELDDLLRFQIQPYKSV